MDASSQADAINQEYVDHMSATRSQEHGAFRMAVVGFVLIIVGIVVCALANPWGVLPLLAGLLLLLWNHDRSANGSGDVVHRAFTSTHGGPRTIIERLSDPWGVYKAKDTAVRRQRNGYNRY
jgi:hypothetical protein